VSRMAHAVYMELATVLAPDFQREPIYQVGLSGRKLDLMIAVLRRQPAWERTTETLSLTRDLASIREES
jgi:hypothetical protein